MNSIETLTTFLGWCTVINVVFVLGLIVRGRVLKNFSARVFDVPTEEVKTAYMNAFMHYRTAILVFNLAPYLALKIMA